MGEEYIREIKIKDLSIEEKQSQLMISIIKAKKELDIASKNFEFAEGDLIDYYTYQMKAARAKLDYLIKRAKREGINLPMLEQIELRHKEAI